MLKKISILFLFVALCSVPFVQQASANHKGECSSKGGSCCGEHGKSGCPIVAKIMKKGHFYLDNQKEIGLKEDQVRAIKAIKMDVKKAEIRQMAEMQVFMIDMHSKLSEPKVDADGLNKMIDTMSSEMAASGKATVASYIKLKSVLTDEQTAKAKAIWMQQEAA